MTKIFIGGSRRVSRLNSDVRRRIDRMIEQGFPLLVGDANGVDKAVQKYLLSRGYNRVEVFCTEGICRNNLGKWEIRPVPAPRGIRSFRYYAVKDRRMAEEASIGFMIWDGKSFGTLTNVFRLVHQRKKVVVYTVPFKRFSTLRDESDWDRFLSQCENEIRERIHDYARSEVSSSLGAGQGSLL